MAVPEYVVYTLNMLRNAGHEAWLVGGCVRDSLLGRRVGDYDVTTSARPEQVMALFPRTVPTGLKHGTVTVLRGRGRVEVTTYRVDGGYRDGRHPEQVQFTARLEEDLARRDFTVNAMAMDLSGNLRDPYGGRVDLAAGILRCVGDPDRRFEEDALRMLRALRFSAQLGFVLAPETRAALARNAHRAALLSPERVREELEKLLLSPRPELAGEVVRLGLLGRFLQERGGHYAGLRHTRRNRMERWAAFCALSGGEPKLLTALRLDRHTVRTVSRGLAIGDASPGSGADWRRLCRDHGAEAVEVWAAARDAVRGSALGRQLRRELARGEPYRVTDLAVNGDDLAALGIRGRAVGRVLQELTERVIENPEDNRRDRLLRWAKECCATEMTVLK